MTWGELFGLAGTILGIAAALDFAVRKSVKKKISTKLKNTTRPGGSFDYRGSAALDRVFGTGLFSGKALFRYALISTTSIAASYGFALFTTFDPASLKQIDLFPKGATSLGALVLVTCVSFAVIGDFASYAITRLFIRTVDEYRNPVISAGLIAADVISSLALFFLSFSIARLLSYLLVLSSGQNTLLASDNFSPDILKAGTSLLNNPSFDINNKKSSLTLTALLAAADSEQSRRKASEYFKQAEIPQSLSSGASSISYIAREGCLKDVTTWATASNTSIDLVLASADELNESRTSKIDVKKVKDSLSRFSYSLDYQHCSSALITIERRLPASTLLSVSGPANSYLAALERTAFDAYSVTSYKLAPYVNFDPSASLPDYYTSLQSMMENTFLAMSLPDQDKVSLISTYTAKEQNGNELVNVPFSPMVASSLTSSLIFLVYLLSGLVVSLRNKLLAASSRQLTRFDLDTAVFTTVALTISAILLFLKFSATLTSLAWQLLV